MLALLLEIQQYVKNKTLCSLFGAFILKGRKTESLCPEDEM